MKTRHLRLLLSLLLVPALVTPAAAQTADQVVEKYLVAMGGREALGKLTSRKATGTITISTPNGDLSGPVEVYSKAPNKTRAYMTLDLSALGVSDKMLLDNRFDGTTGWSLNSWQGDTEITGNQLDNMRNNAFPSQFLDYKASGTKIEVLPKETLDGKAVIVLLITPKVGSVTRAYLDADTYLILRTVAKINVPQAGGDLEQIAQASDYRTVDGVKVPFMTVNSTPIQTATVKLDTVVHNVAIDDAMFAHARYLMTTLTSNRR
jgi:outer membrane lipoprotein-sorting protein